MAIIRCADPAGMPESSFGSKVGSSWRVCIKWWEPFDDGSLRTYMSIRMVTVSVKSEESTLAELIELIGDHQTRSFDHDTLVSSRNPESAVRGYANWSFAKTDPDESTWDVVTETLRRIAAIRDPEWDVSLVLMVIAREMGNWMELDPDVISALALADGALAMDAHTPIDEDA